jgi:hypothetical protein
MDEFSKKYILLDRVQKWVVDATFKFSKLLEDVAGIIKFVKQIEADGFERRFSAPCQQSRLKKNAPCGKGCKKFVFGQWQKDQNGSEDGDHQQNSHQILGTKRMKDRITVVMVVAKMECPNKKVDFKLNHVCATDQILEGDFVAKASSFNL